MLETPQDAANPGWPMDYSDGDGKDQDVNREAESKKCAREVSEWNKDFIRNWARSHLCHFPA